MREFSSSVILLSLLLLRWDENEIEESLIQPFIASHKNLGSSTEPALTSIKVFNFSLRKVQKSQFLRSEILNRQRGALRGVPRSVKCAATILWSDKEQGLMTTSCISERAVAEVNI